MTIESTTAMIEVRSPADGRVVGSVPNLGADEVARLAADLRVAQPAWEDLGPEGRGKVMRAWGDWFLDNEQGLGELVQAESGKAWADAVLEATVSVELMGYYARHAAGFLAARKVRPHGPAGAMKRLEVRFRPHPLVGII